MKLTKSQRRALKWLADHNGEGAFIRKDRTNRSGYVLLAAGEIAPFMRVSFNALRDAGLAEISHDRRIKLTASGRKAAA